jgi:hypothetical protein
MAETRERLGAEHEGAMPCSGRRPNLSKTKPALKKDRLIVASSHLSAAFNSSTQELAKLCLSFVLP